VYPGLVLSHSITALGIFNVLLLVIGLIWNIGIQNKKENRLQRSESYYRMAIDGAESYFSL